ncbi:uncharacterized protein LOC118434323 isoform X2 [Folsomia candida]|uniref:uncharacterized protein LOC118434323 isoform X2 n=1 Tax=Folsomia candida TaxID=158441 RepID=UPI001604D445|nr:uncharacterized protein LOC118434323 isoform X2 [Folsomia candida]
MDKKPSAPRAPSLFKAKTKSALANLTHQQAQEQQSPSSTAATVSSFQAKIQSQQEKATMINAEAQKLSQRQKDVSDRIKNKNQQPSLSQTNNEQTTTTTQKSGSSQHLQTTPSNTLILPSSQDEKELGRGSSSSSTGSNNSAITKEFEEAFVLLSLADAQNASSGKDLLPIYQARLVQVQVALIICTLILAALAAFVQYIYFVLPWYLAARVHIAHAVLMPTGSEAIYQFWIIFVVGLILLFVGNALVQYPRTVMWKILGEWRWLFPFALCFYLISTVLYYSTQTELISEAVTKIMEDDFKSGKTEPLQLMQLYHVCCGLTGPDDWTLYAYNETHSNAWHGNLCNKTNRMQADFGNPDDNVASCLVPSSCWFLPNEFPDFRNARMVRQTGCVNWEVRFTTSIVFAWIGILAVYVSATDGNVKGNLNRSDATYLHSFGGFIYLWI